MFSWNEKKMIYLEGDIITMQITAKYVWVYVLFIGLFFFEISFAATQSLASKEEPSLTKKMSNLSETDAFYIALNSQPGIRRQVTNSLDDIVNGQTDIKNILSGKASKAGARRIIQMIEELSENKVEKADLEAAVKSLGQEISSISNTLIALSTKLSPQQRIQILAEIKTEQQHIKERISEMSDRIQKINTQYLSNANLRSRDHSSDISKIASTQSEINDIFNQLKQEITEQTHSTSGHLNIIVCFLVIIFAGIVVCIYLYIKQQGRIKAEIFEKTEAIVKEQYDHLIEQLYVEEHEDGRLTADDLKKMSEQVKKRVVRQNWAKRKVEERPAFI